MNYSFNFCCSLKAKSILEVSKIYKGSLAYYLALNVDIIEVFVPAKPSWQILLSNKNPVSVPTLLFAKNMQAKMKIFIAQPLFPWVRFYSSWIEGLFRNDVSSKSFKSVFF